MIDRNTNDAGRYEDEWCDARKANRRTTVGYIISFLLVLLALIDLLLTTKHRPQTTNHWSPITNHPTPPTVSCNHIEGLHALRRLARQAFLIDIYKW